jgi:hypothetical protein
MSTKCVFCNDTKQEPGIDGPCVWCEVAAPADGEPEVTRYSESCMEGGGVAPDRNGELCDFHHVARLVAEREALQLLLNERDEKLDAAKRRIERLRHVGMELTGVIDEYRAMPCDSLKVRMFSTADRYRKRLMAKCGNCEDHGVIGYTTGQTPETFDQGEYPCPECQPTEYAAWSKP